MPWLEDLKFPRGYQMGTHINILTEEQLKTYLDLSNKFCSISVTKEGAIASYPTMEELR